MIVIGYDFDPSFQQQVAVLDMETGECAQHKLMHATGEAEQFYLGSSRYPGWYQVKG